MRSNYLKATLKTAVLALSVLLLGAGVSFAQSVNLTAQPQHAGLPDGQSVPMWGLVCTSATTATCTSLHFNSTVGTYDPQAGGDAWQPPLIVVPYSAAGTSLTINLTNNLSFGTTPNNVPTSLVIVGQLGGGLGDLTKRTTTTSPDHSNAQTITWPIADPTTPGTPPRQGDRVQSFSTEVAAAGSTPVGNQVPSGSALTWLGLRPGTYLIESGTHPSIQGPMGLYGILVVTNAPTKDATTGTETASGTAYPGVSYDAEVPLLLSEIDPVQNNAVTAAVNAVGFSESATIPVSSATSNNISRCIDGAVPVDHCYPPAVNYTPLYYLFNGVAFDKTHSSASLFPISPATTSATTGSVLVRLVNAGLRMHVPSIVGSLTGTPAVGGFSLIAEDGNPLPGVPRVQSEVFMAAGKTYDVMVNVPASGSALPVFDRQLSLSANATARDAGMLAYISINGAALPSATAFTAAVANEDTYGGTCTAPCRQLPGVIAGQTLTVSDPAKGVVANDINIYGVQVVPGSVTGGTLNLNANGTFTFAATSGSGSFQYCGNGITLSVPPPATLPAACTTVTLNGATIEAAGGITVNNDTYTSNVATFLSIKSPGVLENDKDTAGHPLTVDTTTVSALSGPGAGTLSVDSSGAFNVTTVSMPGTYTFTYKAKNSQGTLSGTGGSLNDGTATVTLIFPPANGPLVTVVDGMTKTEVTVDGHADYRWIIEEDRTFYINPTNTATTGSTSTDCSTNPPACVVPPTFGTNFHTSYMPLVAQGCVGTLSCAVGQTMIDASGNHVNAVCDVGNGVCRPDPAGIGQTPVLPNEVHLDTAKRYYITVLPGDGADALADPALGHAHGMGGSPLAYIGGAWVNPGVTPAGTTTVTVLVEPTPLQPAKLSVFVFEDDFPLNGEHDAGGGIDILASNEPGLGGFEITLFDDAGGSGDATGQPTYDMFNMPLSNSLAGTIDPATGNDACPISAISRNGIDVSGDPADPNDGKYVKNASATGITGMIVTCPKYESDGKTLSPLAGQAVVANLYPGRYGVVATPGADRIARGEEWMQTNTLDGQKAHDSFLRVGEPNYFQEYGPAGYHVSIGFANPGIINGRYAGVCNGRDPNLTGTHCTNTVTGKVTTERMSRPPDERLYSSGSNDSFAFTQCYVSLGDTDGEDFAFTKCDDTGSFTLRGIPDGTWRVTVFDQWNDMLVDGLSTPVALDHNNPNSGNLGQIAMNQWQANIYTATFFDQDADGVRGPNEPGLSLVSTNIRFRDGSFSNFNNTDLSGNAGFNEIFPLFSWYVVETTATRFKNTGTHVVYDAGGPADRPFPLDAQGNQLPCPLGQVCTNTGGNFANTLEQISLPANLRVPGARYCASADCPTGDTTGGSTGRVDPPWVLSEGWQGFSGQNSFIEFGKKPFEPGENGGIYGHVVYASTRPFDDPQMLLQLSWEPQVPGVTINLYQEGTALDGSQSLTLVDHTTTSSWDDWAQGFRSDGVGGLVPNMNCPGQGRDTGTNADLFFFSLFNQPMWLDLYNNGGTPAHTIPNNSQFKCYDGMHNWNQVQPAPYDGMYAFPSVLGRDPSTGLPTGTNCTICGANPTGDGTQMLPSGKYVVEVVVPPGYELVKEEDKNILIGDTYIAPVVQQFAGLGNIFIIPDQAAVGASYNANNALNPTTDLGVAPRHEGDTGSVETFWPCVGASRIVPDYISLFPGSKEVSPFAGATRNLCDRKEVTLEDQSSALAKFYIFSSVHVAAHFTGVITDDFTSEFDPFSPQFGEKFSPPNLPISIKDFAGNEISRVYTDQWGAYNGLNYSSWEVNPPNPTGYAPQMMVTCMNDPGTGTTPDLLFNPSYSQFCYEIPFMPGQTQYMDTPVTPTSAFASAGYNNPDCAYSEATPAVSEVDGDGVGPWVSAPGHTLTIHALAPGTGTTGGIPVPNNGYSGPSATAAPFNQKTVARHYGFGDTPGTVALVGSDGVAHNLTGVGWSDATITGTVPGGVPQCALQQQAQYGGPTGTAAFPFAQCGQLVITRGDNGKQSIDTVTVTIGGKAPTHVLATDTIQGAIDAALPGDLLIVDPAVHNELLLMWKPVRLQGVGAASSIINANTHPAGKLDGWRAQVNCLFGLALNGQPYSTPGNLVPLPGGGGNEPLNLYDPAGVIECGSTGGIPWAAFSGGPNNPQVDRLPLEGIVGWDTTVNGNLAELLQEPSLMGAYEGAGITVLAKGVRFPAGVEVFGAGQDSATGSNIAHESQMPLGTVLLKGSDCATSGTNPANPFPSNFQCNPSSIDGLSITDSSQGGGAIFAHAWAHNLQIANNRIHNNSGTQSGGINIGQGESPDAYLAGNNGDPVGFDQQPWTCVPGAVVNGIQNANPPGFATNAQLPYCFNLNVNVHHNAVTRNSSIGDELFSSTPAGAGGVTFCIGADYYKFNYNWVCGNLSSGDGGGLSHMGFIYNGDIEHNSILFNQSTNPTIPTNGGGIIVMGAAPDGAPSTGGGVNECGSFTDVDCAPGLTDGTGPGLVINANMIMGNAAESGSGGGIRLQDVNGTEVGFFPLLGTPTTLFGIPLSPGWNSVNVTNNIIANNVAGWDGAGVSLQDALMVNFINNTVISNDTTASSGVLFNTLGAPLASAPGPTCTSNCGTASAPQPAGLVSMQNTSLLTASLGTVLCPSGHGTIGSLCKNYSVPVLYNNVFWQNRSFYIGVGSLGTGTLNQQHVVALYNSFTSTQAVTQPTTGATTTNGSGAIIAGGTGACVSASYWDIGVRGDTGPTDHSSGLTLTPMYSTLTDASDYPGGILSPSHNTGLNPTAVSQYCNGSRTPPEFKSLGYQVPPGISDATVPNPIFNLTPAATVDEGNNWINMSWGPLALTNPLTNATLGNYALAAGSPAINFIPTNEAFPLLSGLTFPTADFFGHTRPFPGTLIDVGAVEFQAAASTTLPTLTAINPASHAPGGAAFTVTLTGTSLTGTTAVNISGTGVTHGTFTVNAAGTVLTTTFTVAAGTTALGTHNVSVTKAAGTSNPVTFTVANAPTLTLVAPNAGTRGSSVPVTLTGTNFVPGATVGVTGAGVTAGNVIVVSATSITATFTINPNAGLGAHNVSVTTPGGTTTGTHSFTVNNPSAPTLTLVDPNTGTRGNSVLVTLTGTNFTTTGTTVNVTRPGGGNNGVTANNVTVVNSTTITATFTIAANAGGSATSARNVSVTTPGGTTVNRTFTVTNPPAPTLTSVTPNVGPRGFDVDVKLVGTNFTFTGGSVSVSGAGVTASPLLVDTAVNAETTLIIDPAAGLGPHSIRVTTPGGTSNPVTFTVQGPTVTSISSPASGAQGTTVSVTLTGTLLMGATNVTAGAGITASSITSSVSGNQVTATFTIAPGAAPGPRNVRVVTPNGTTPVNTAVTFTVTAAPAVAALAAISPAFGVRGAVVPVTLTGTNLGGVTSLNVSGEGVTVSGVSVVDSNTITANIAIGNRAPRTARNVRISGGGRGTDAVTFTVN